MLMSMRIDILAPKHNIWRSLLEYPASGVSYSELTLMRARLPSRHITHFGNGLPYTMRRRAIVDFESAKAFYRRPTEGFERRRLKEDMIYVALSDSARATFGANIVNRCDVRVIRPGVRVARRARAPMDTATAKDGGFNIVLVGGSTGDGSFFGKGGLYLLDALKRLGDRSIRLHVVSVIDHTRPRGEGPTYLDSEGRPWTELLREALGAGWLRNHGALPHEAVLDLMASSQLAAIPALYDTVCYSLMEAAYLGTPVLTSDTMFMKEFYGDIATLVPAPASYYLEDGAFNFRFDEQVREVRGEVSSRWADIIHAAVDSLSRVSEFESASERAKEKFEGSIDTRNKALSELYAELEAR